MKSLHESILNSTGSGQKEYLAKKTEELLKVERNEDFMIDDNNKVYLWSVPSNTTIDMSTWPEELQFSLFDSYIRDVKITVNGQKEYEKFLKCFDCSIGNGNATAAVSKSDFLPKIIFKNCKVDSIKFTHHYYCTMIFKKCQVDISRGLNAFDIEIDNCITELPYNFTILKSLKIKK